MTSSLRSTAIATTACATLLLAGCVRVDSHKNGKDDDVNISTPFGSMKVKTNDSVDTTAIGLSAYPGAVPVKESNNKDNDAADVNLNFGSFHLGVKAATFQTSDSPAKVEAFYRKDMAHYGDVIKCHGHDTIGQPTRTSQGLTCSDNDKNSIHTNVNDNENPELRAGSPQHQHIVGLEPKNGGTKIGLVLLDLPTGSHDKSDSE